MTIMFILNIIIGLVISIVGNYLFELYNWNIFGRVEPYWISTAHPLSRIPVFFMGICAGALCVRIQQGSLEALNCKFQYKPLKTCVFGFILHTVRPKTYKKTEVRSGGRGG